ncbi:MAG: SRPBCC family protein [Candidatus Ranarchaeia archaeon]
MTWSVREKILNFPPDVVFKLLTDFERLGHAIPSLRRIEYLSDVKRGVGTRTRWYAGVGIASEGGAVMEWEEEVTAFIENELIGFKVLNPDAPFTGFLRVYPYDMGTKSFVVFAENHDYEGADISKIREFMMGQLNFMEKELQGELKDDSHKETA